MFLITNSEALRLAISELHALHGSVKSYHKSKGDSVIEDKPPINVWYNDRCREAKRRYTQCALTHSRGSEAAFQELKRYKNTVKATKHSWMKACDKERMNNFLKAP
jgi:flagellar basal body-associated protein FliL